MKCAYSMGATSCRTQTILLVSVLAEEIHVNEWEPFWILGVLVSQHLTTHYVLLEGRRCDGCVTIGSNCVYGGVGCVWWVGSLY